MSPGCVPLLRLFPSCSNHFYDFLVCFPASTSLSPFRVHSDYRTRFPILWRSLDHVILQPQTPWRLSRAHQMMFMPLICYSLSACSGVREADFCRSPPPAFLAVWAFVGPGRWLALAGCWRVVGCLEFIPHPLSSWRCLILAETKSQSSA